MEFIIERSIKKNKYIYKAYDESDIIAQSNFTFGILLRKISVSIGQAGDTYVLKQLNSFIKILVLLTMFWVLPIDLVPKYTFFHNNIKKGNTKWSFSTPKRILIINNSYYEFCLHSDNYVSIMKNDNQIALIKKANITIGEKNHYTILFVNNLEKDIALLFLFIAFVDITFFPNQLKLSYYRYEKTIGKDRFYDRVIWRPVNT